LHQRLLDGLMAGGFFLVRTHPADVAPAALLRHLHTHGDVPSPALTALIEQSRSCLCTTGDEDVVGMVRAWQEAGQLTVVDGPLPMFGEVSFDDRASLAGRVGAYVASADARDAVVTCQRRSISARLCYDAGVRRVVGRIRELLDEPSAASAGRRAA
jgi:hypothetical protein